MFDDPWAHAVRLTLATNTPTSKHIQSLINNSTYDIKAGIEFVRQSIINSASSRRLTYKVLNPSLTVHEVYKCRGHVNEVHRVAFSRLRVIGHTLAIETGRWNRRGRGRLEVAERLCPCGTVQTELHILESCPLIQDIRIRYNFTAWTQTVDDDAQFPIAEIVQ